MPKNELSNLPTRVYRSDLRSPDEVFSNGMPISGTDDDIYRHVNGSSCKKGTSAFLATSDNLEFLKKHWAKDGLLMSKQDFIYIYEIIPDARFFNAYHSLSYTSKKNKDSSLQSTAERFKHQGEWLAKGGVSAENIASAEVYGRTDKGNNIVFIKRVENSRVTATPSANAYPYQYKSSKDKSGSLLSCFGYGKKEPKEQHAAGGISPHCIPCEKNNCWIEIDVRDEHNQSFQGLKATLTDATGTAKTVTLQNGPTLVEGFAVGPVTVKLETKSWLKAAQSREALKEGETSQVPAYTDKLFGHDDVKREHVKVTSGDLCLTDPEQPLPEGHKAGQAQPPRFITKHSYVIEVKSYQFTTLRIGVFFDGTGNNTHNAQAGLQKVEQWLLETCSDPDQREKELRSCQMGQSPVEGSSANDVTNVGKLFEQYDITAGPLVSHTYISGIGTRDPIAGENGPKYRSDDTLTQGFDLDFGGENTSIIGKVEVACQQSIVRSINRDLGEVLVDVDCIHRIELDVFGFSRGAAAARHFVNVIDKKADHPLVQAIANSPNIRLKAGFDWASRDDVRFTFVGLFDTVVSSYNPNVNVQLKADCAERVVHLTALDEVRKYFPLSRITEDAAGASIPAHFTELALPGAHSDIGGGYYSRWSLSNPNSDPALIECIELERFMSVETVSTPDTESIAYQKAKAYAEEKRTLGWVNRINYSLPRGAVPLLGAISLKPYSFRRPEGKNSTGPGKKSVYVEVLMSRVVEGEYSRIPLHMMVEAGRAVGVPFKAWMPDDRALQLEPLSIKRPEADLKALDKLWALSAIEQKVAKNLAHQLSPDVYHALRRDYLHHSASNQGIANPANTNKYESSISKERRKLIGNKEA
ncbi:phospholipase effector Tle1 domain-containing protein [Aeromonas jandaei]|uniref:phospholipase effector Tle1 domain-containing protein n=1 Tax=Aeromonas jandaei TaxID=650 RepID=UPI003986D832